MKSSFLKNRLRRVAGFLSVIAVLSLVFIFIVTMLDVYPFNVSEPDGMQLVMCLFLIPLVSYAAGSILERLSRTQDRITS
jgi:hypothetical protein